MILMPMAFVWARQAVLYLLLGALAVFAVTAQLSSVRAQEDEGEDEEFELYFFATPRVATKGEQILLEWEAPGADSCIASDNWSGTKTPVGNQYVMPKKFKKYTYTLECFTNEGEQTGEISRVVEVVKKKPSKGLPFPKVTFRTSKTTIVQGGTITLSWRAKNAVGCRASGPDGWDGLKNASGKEIVAPDNSTTYTLKCWNADRKYSDEHSVSIAVKDAATDTKSGYLYEPPSPQPLTGPSGGAGRAFGQQQQSPLLTPTQFGPWAYPPGYFNPPAITITPSLPEPVRITFKPSSYTFKKADEPIVLTWRARYATMCIASGGWSGERPIEGSEHVRPAVATEYKLTCYNSETSLDAVASLELRKVDPKIKGSVGLEFSPARSIIHSGKEVTLSWNAYNARSCQASGAWSGEKSLAGSVTINPSKSETYYLDCKNDSHSKRKSAVIDMFEAEAPKPIAVDNKAGYQQEQQPSPAITETKTEQQQQIVSPAPALSILSNAAVSVGKLKQGTKGVVVASFVATNNSDQDRLLRDITLSDNGGMSGLGAAFENIMIYVGGRDGRLFGSMKGTGTTVTGGQNTLTGTETIPARGTVSFFILADVLSGATLLKSDAAVSILSAKESTAASGARIISDVKALPITLQPLSIEQPEPSRLSAFLDAASPSGKIFEQDTKKAELARFGVKANDVADVSIKGVDLTMDPFAADTLLTLSVYDGETLIGSVGSVVSATSNISFANPLIVGKSGTKVLRVVADISAKAKTVSAMQVSLKGVVISAPEGVQLSAFPVSAAQFAIKEKPASTTQSSSATTQTQSTSAVNNSNLTIAT